MINLKRIGWYVPIIVTFIFPPVGIILLILKAVAEAKYKNVDIDEYVGYDVTSSYYKSYANKGKIYKIVGWMLTLLSSFMAAAVIFTFITDSADEWYLLIPVLFFFAGGILRITRGIYYSDYAKRYSLYFPLIEGKNEIDLAVLAEQMDLKVSTVENDLVLLIADDMLEDMQIDTDYKKLVSTRFY